MSLETGLRARLVGTSAVSAIVGSKVFHEWMPQNTTLPAVTYTRVGDSRIESLDGPVAVVFTRFRIDAWSTTSAQCKTLADAIRASLQGLRDNLATGVPIERVLVETEQDLSELNGDEATRRINLEIVIVHNDD